MADYNSDRTGSNIDLTLDKVDALDAQLQPTATGVKLDDGKKITFGASDDLQIYHDGSQSYIKDAGTGDLRILASDLRILNSDATKYHIFSIDGGYTRLYYDGSQKLATTSTGVDVTGTITADGLTVAGDINVSGGVYLGGTGAANKLDDYEEGTFTPVLTDGTNNATWANEAVGFYTKVGNVVNFFIRFNSSSTAIGTHAYNAVTGLPFTLLDSELCSIVNVSRCFGIPPNNADFTTGVTGTAIVFRGMLSNNEVVTFSPTGNTVRLTLAGTYRTA